jgi:hypothetical protein
MKEKRRKRRKKISKKKGERKKAEKEEKRERLTSIALVVRIVDATSYLARGCRPPSGFKRAMFTSASIDASVDMWKIFRPSVPNNNLASPLSLAN